MEFIFNNEMGKQVSEANQNTEEKEKTEEKIPTDDLLQKLQKMERLLNEKTQQTESLKQQVEELRSFADSFKGLAVEELKQALTRQYPELPPEMVYAIAREEMTKYDKITDKNMSQYLSEVHKRLGELTNKLSDKSDLLARRNLERRLTKLNLKPLREGRTDDDSIHNLSVLLKLAGIDDEPEKKLKASKRRRIPTVDEFKKAFQKAKYDVDPDDLIDAIFDGIEDELL